MQLENLVRLLTTQGRAILALLYARYRWSEIATLFGLSTAATKEHFWRDINRAQSQIENGAETQVDAQPDSSSDLDG